MSKAVWRTRTNMVDATSDITAVGDFLTLPPSVTAVTSVIAPDTTDVTEFFTI